MTRRAAAGASPHRNRRLAALLVGGLVLTAALLRVAAANRELWLDETHSALLASLPPSRLLAFVEGDVHPPLYFFLLSGWTAIAGASPLALRGFSIVVSLLAIITTYVAGVRLLGQRAGGVLAAGFLALHPVVLWYSVEVRMYALALLLLALALCLLPVPGRPPSAIRTIGLGVAALAACLTHYVALFAVAGLLAFLATEGLHDPRRRTVAWTAGLIVLLGFAPWIPTMLHQRELKAELRAAELAGLRDSTALNYQNTESLPQPLTDRAVSLAENAASAAGMLGLDTPGLALLAGIPIIVAVIAVVLLGLQGAPASRLLLFVGAGLLLGCLLIGATARRFMLLAVPCWTLALAELVIHLRAAGHRRSGAALSVSLLLTFLGGVTLMVRSRPARPIEESVSYLQGAFRPGDLLVFSAAYFEIPFAYYAQRSAFDPPTMGFPQGIHSWWLRQEFKGWGGPVVSTADLAEFVPRARARVGQGTLWLVLYETGYYDPRERLRTALETQGHLVAGPFRAGGIRITGYRFGRDSLAVLDSREASGDQHPDR